MMAAMARIKALQEAGIRNLAEIADATLETVKDAVGDEKSAKQLRTSAKTALKNASETKKRGASDEAGSSDMKRRKSAYELNNEPETAEAREATLALPQASSNVDEITETVLFTNRAPLLLTFALTLLKFTRPEQPLCSRLSLAQALVSVNSRSKAVSLGIETGSAEQDGWGQGQPKIKIMGREIFVLKRCDYNVPSEETNDDDSTAKSEDNQEIKDLPKNSTESIGSGVEGNTEPSESKAPSVAEGNKWTVSQKITSKQSTFVARSIPISSSMEARRLREQLLSTHEDLREASHNISAWRVRGEEVRDDDGESGGGTHVLKILQDANIDGVMLIVTRWYGGTFLGTDRWRIISEACHDALSQRLRVSSVSGEALWGLDLETAKSSRSSVTGMPTHKPENARAYIMNAFTSPPDGDSKKKKTGPAVTKEKEKNLGLLIGALEMLFSSWVGYISREELDRRAWSWYAQLRPEVSDGVAGWGAKGQVQLSSILNLRRKQ